MNIDIKKFASLTSDEIQFLYCMMVAYGEMPNFVETPPQSKNNRTNKNRKNNYKAKSRPFKKKDNTKPDLYNFNDSLWEKCEDKKFLAYRIIMEKTGI